MKTRQEENLLTCEDCLRRILADTFILSLKTRHYHWNVKGLFFSYLHPLLNTVYEDLDNAGDKIAERIRALGFPVQGSYAYFLKTSAIKEETDFPNVTTMLQTLLKDMVMLVDRTNMAKETALAEQDDVTADLLINYLTTLEKVEWILRSHLEDNH